MIRLDLNLPEDMLRELDSRVRDGAFASVEEYVRALIESHLGREDEWEMTAELASALEEGEKSGVDPRSLDGILVEARKRWSR